MTIAKVIVQDTDFHAGRYVQDGTIEWELAEVGRPGAIETGTCRFVTRLGASLPFVPKRHMYVELVDDEDELRFAGRVARVERLRELGVDQPRYVIECHDWVPELDRINVDQDFTFAAGDNDKHVAQTYVDAYWDQLATTGVTHRIFASHHNLPEIETTQGQMSLKGVLENAGSLAGATAWLDPGKALHWNDVQEVGAVVLDDENKSGDYRSYYYLRDRDEATAVAFRVTVIGAGGAIATVTDWAGFHAYARQRRYERGSPVVRIPQLDDHTDLSLTTNAECRAVGWVLLDRQAPLRQIEVGMRGTFVYPGQVVDLIDEQGREEPSYAWLDEEDLWAPGRPTRLHLRLGRFQVRSVRPQPLGGGEYDYVATLGAYRPVIEQIVRAA